MGMGWHYRRSYETVLVAEKPGAPCNWNDETNKIENIIRPGQYGIRKIIPSDSDHPTPKPIELAAHFISLHSKPGETVLDPFMGHGWVAEACKLMGRRFIGIEIDQSFCDRAVDRMSQGVLFGAKEAM
jgi:site-specific DNA-methyltransferase (adenine-specific)